VLIVVLAMLALFAIVGISFVMYAESQASISRNDRASRSIEGDPNTIEGANQALGNMIFDAQSNSSAVFGHGIARTRYGPTAGTMIPFTGAPSAAGATLSASSNTPYTYADRSNLFLAIQDPTNGKIVVKSFHRDDLFNLATAAGTGVWVPATGRNKILRPLPLDHSGFPYPPPNADGSVTGDICNMKFTTNTQQNDSVWLYMGAPVKNWRGKQYTYLVAPLILDLSGRVNLSASGMAAGSSSMGYGPWEINPAAIAGVNAPNAIALRGAVPSERYTNQASYPFNGGLVTPGYSLVDLNGGGADGAIGPIGKPTANGYSPFPVYSPRFESTQAAFDAARTGHPAQFNPLVFPRGRAGVHAFGLDEVVRLGARYSSGASWYNAASLTPNVTTAQSRAMTTPFSVSSHWGQVTLNGNKLGPIDLNRPLADYRADTTKAYHPENMGNAAQARRDRQNLARDIFVRLAAVSGQAGNSTYDPGTGYLITDPVGNPNDVNNLRPLAQLAVNIVDNIDRDDISTTFVWNPVDQNDPTNIANFAPGQLGTRVVFGTELPRLVVNEAYCALMNDRDDPTTVMGMQKAAKNLQKKYWVELHNPLSNSPALSETGAARLQWQQNVSPDAAGTGKYAGGSFAAYRLDIMEVVNSQPPQPYIVSETFAADPKNVIGDPAQLPGDKALPKIALDNYTYDATAPAAAATLGGDSLNLVLPVNDAASGTQGKNEGYYVVGPKDKFPAAGVTTTLSVADPAAMAAAPTATMSYDAGMPSNANLNTQKDTTSAVLLRRLANPYTAPQLDPGQANYNPYITVDYMENVPTRNRVLYDETPRMNPLMPAGKDDPTVGRKHPYTAGPAYNQPNANIIDQTTAAATPPHTFFGSNSGLTNANGLAWLAHFDRELVNSIELLQAHPQPPHRLTQRFSNGTTPQNHLGLVGGTTSLFLTGNYYQTLDVLTTRSRYIGTPLGGRIAGKVNINAIQDPTIFTAVMDPQTGNAFDSNTVTRIWDTLRTSRSPSYPRSSTSDRPFRSMIGANTFDETLLRDSAASPGTPLAMFQNLTPTSGFNHAYAYQDPLRKSWNNLTTTSDSFLMIFTVGVFEVTDPTGGPNGMPKLGKELGRHVAGDMRQQYAAVIDRSMLTITGIGSTTLADSKPWEVDLVQDAEVGSPSIVVRGTFVDATKFTVFRDGNTDTFNTNDTVANNRRVRVGFADANNTGDGMWLTVSAVANGPTPGTVSLTVPALPRFYGAGTPVRNCILGNPGPTAGIAFDYRDPKYQGVVPYFTRIDP